MKKYVATRVIKGIYNEYLVQAQNERTLNWETLVRYPINQKEIAKIDACNKAKKFSKENGYVPAYDCNGYSMKTFLNGEEYKRG